MDNLLFTGEKVRLAAEDAETMAKALSRWSGNSEYLRMLTTNPAVPFSQKATKKWLDEFLGKIEEQPDHFPFAIYTLEDNRLIGHIGLDGIQWNHGDAFVGIGIGERDFWSKGYGTDAMRVLLRYAFMELNLHRVTLDVFEYNPRAIRAYEKAGFVIEGRSRQYLLREGKRWDMIFMGILREEWERRTL